MTKLTLTVTILSIALITLFQPYQEQCEQAQRLAYAGAAHEIMSSHAKQEITDQQAHDALVELKEKDHRRMANCQ